jgi:hypothetical protein
MDEELQKIIEEKARQLIEEQERQSQTPTESQKLPAETTETTLPEQVTEQPKNEPQTPVNYAEQAEQLIDAMSNQIAVTDGTLVDSVAQSRKKEIIHRANANLKKEEAENKNADIVLQEANYGVYSGVAGYAGIKKPLPQKMQSILFAILSAVQTICLIIFGIPISIINIIADGIDSVVKKLGTLTKSAMWIVLVALIGGLGFTVFAVIRFFLAKAGIN